MEDNLVDSIFITYFNITGNRPTRNTDWAEGGPYGAFYTLVKEVFEILSMKKGAQASARRAVERYAKGYGEKGG